MADRRELYRTAGGEVVAIESVPSHTTYLGKSGDPQYWLIVGKYVKAVWFVAAPEFKEPFMLAIEKAAREVYK